MKLALLFPGQGSQSVGMGADLAASSDAARAVYAAADGALGEPLSRLCFEGPDAQLASTANTQPALVATSLAALAALRERVGRPLPVAFAAGHSLGEYSALAAAGVFGTSDAVRLVRARGAAMQEAVPAGQGAMAAVMGLSATEIVALCREAAEGGVVTPANFNGPQVVIAGDVEAVGRARRLAEARRAKVVMLNVSAPFHCPLMAPAARALRGPLERVALGTFAFPVVANVDASPNEDPARVTSLLLAQVDGPVRWEESVRFLVAAGVTHALEVGPGKVLAGLVKRIDKSLTVSSCGDVASVAAAAEFIASMT